MRRRVLTILALLLAGAVVNVAVAWGCVAFGTYSVDDRPRGAEREIASLARAYGLKSSGLPMHSVSGVGHDVVTWMGGDPRFPETLAEVERMGESEIQSLMIRHFAVIRAGIPLRSMMGHFYQDLARSSGEKDGPWFYRDLWMLTSRPIESLPLRPRWPGFAVNTALYAAVLWLLIPGPFALRRFIRLRRGLCPACGYDMTHAQHESCPECGAAYG